MFYMIMGYMLNMLILGCDMWNVKLRLSLWLEQAAQYARAYEKY